MAIILDPAPPTRERTKIESVQALYEKVTGREAPSEVIERWRQALGQFADLPHDWRTGNAVGVGR